MKQRIIKTISALALFAITGCVALVFVGCTSTYARWGGERVITDAEGRPLVNKAGDVQKVKEPVELSSWRHWTDSLIGTATLGIRKDEIDFTMQNYSSKPSEELAKTIDVSFKGAAELAAKVGAAIATSGGSVAGEAASAKLRAAIAKFVQKGGNASKATVTCQGGNCTFTDGTVTETCTDCLYDPDFPPVNDGINN